MVKRMPLAAPKAIIVCTERDTCFLSFAPKYLEITTPPPIAVPIKKLLSRKIRFPEEVTAARAFVPRYRPTIKASAVLYNCWNTWLKKTGIAKPSIRE